MERGSIDGSKTGRCKTGGCRIFVLGNAGLDIILRLSRLPLPGESLVGQQAALAPGGKGLNQAVVAARAGLSLGVGVAFRAPVGRDAAGENVASALARETFSKLDLVRLDQPTDLSTVMVLPGGENSIVSAGGCAAALGGDAAASFAAGAGAGDVLLLQGNLSEATTRAAVTEAARRGVIVMVNTAPLWWSPRPLLAECSVIVANRGEARAVSGEADPFRAAAWLCRAGVRLAIVTLGADGCVTVGPEGARHWPAVPAVAVDTTGCGDAFCGVLAVQVARAVPLPDAVAAAQRAASLTAGRAGTFVSLPTVQELAELLAS